jgi:hypothetical protein
MDVVYKVPRLHSYGPNSPESIFTALSPTLVEEEKPWIEVRKRYLEEAFQILSSVPSHGYGKSKSHNTVTSVYVLVVLPTWEQITQVAQLWNEVNHQNQFNRAHIIASPPCSSLADSNGNQNQRVKCDSVSCPHCVRAGANWLGSLGSVDLLSTPNAATPCCNLVLATPRMLLRKLRGQSMTRDLGQESCNGIQMQTLQLMVVDHLEKMVNKAGPGPLVDILCYLPVGMDIPRIISIGIAYFISNFVAFHCICFTLGKVIVDDTLL